MIIMPPDDTILQSAPTVFLAGPIQGTTDWQATACALLDKEDFIIANPRRTSFIKLDDKGFDEQVKWESYWLKRASRDGFILFNLAKETEHTCNRAYAQTTRFELGEWLAKAHQTVVIVTGSRGDFSGVKYIKARIQADYPWAATFETLEEACDYILARIV